MKNIVYFFMILILLVPATFAELELFKTQVEVNIGNNSVTVETEDNQLRTYACSAVIGDTITANIYRETTCKEDELYDYLTNANQQYVDAVTWQQKYNSCLTNATIMESLVYSSGNTSYKSLHTTCDAEKTRLQSLLTTSSNQLTECKNQSSSSKSSTNPLIYVGVGVVVGYLINKQKSAKTPTESLPPR